MMDFETLTIDEVGAVAVIALNRPEKANAFNEPMWRELKAAFEWLDTSKLRVGILCGRGQHFCAGIDLDFFAEVKSRVASLSEGYRQECLRQWIVESQATINAVESCRKPVIAAIHGACIGAGVDLITACDIRYATEDARFSVKEVDVAIVADVGTLQRLPGLVGEGIARELCYTGRTFAGREATAIRLVNQSFADGDALMAQAMAVAETIADKSPLAIRGIKETMNYSRDHSVAEGLEYVALRNAGAMFSSNFDEALAAMAAKRQAIFRD